jgi:heterodisulfide reductase subunit D
MAQLKKYRTQVYSCVRCGVCRNKYSYSEKIFRVCPAGEHSAGFWSNFPIGRVGTALEILDGNLSLSEAPVDAIFKCLLCANCRQVCGALDMETFQPLIDQPSIIKALRADLFDSGAKLPEAVNMFGQAIEKTRNILGAMIEERNDWITDDIQMDTTAETIYFPGCLSTFREQEIAQATAKVLNILDIPFNILGEDEQCCGNPMLMVGNRFLARDLMRHNYDRLKGKKVIASCSGCYRTFIQDYPKLLGEESIVDATHIVKVLAERIDQGQVTFTKTVQQKVVYHDPCELGREMSVYNEPRKILESIPGLEIVEFVRTREKTWCCGGGGALKGVDFNMAVEIAGDKVKEATEVGAQTIISACPACKTNINDGIEAFGSDLVMKDIMELVIEAGIIKA